MSAYLLALFTYFWNIKKNLISLIFFFFFDTEGISETKSSLDGSITQLLQNTFQLEPVLTFVSKF